METVTVSLPGQQDASSQAVVSFGTGVGTIFIDREVLLRSPVLANTILETDEDTSDVCAPAGFLHAWLQYLVPALVSADRHQHRDELDDTEYSMESLLIILRAADFFADEKAISKVCTELCSKLFADVPSRKRLRESSETDDTSEQDGSDESANFTDQEHLSRLVFSGHVPTSHTPRRQLSDCGREVLTQLPSHLAVEIVKALDGGVGPTLDALPAPLHHLAIQAHLPSVSADKALRLDGHTFVLAPSAPVLEALITAVAETPLHSITVCCCCLDVLSATPGVVDAFARMLRTSTELTSLALGGAFCTGSIAHTVTHALPTLPQLRSLTLQPESLGVRRSQQLLTTLAMHGPQLTELSLHALTSCPAHSVTPTLPEDASPHSSSSPHEFTGGHGICAQRAERRSTTALAAALLRLTTLESLHLTGDTLTGRTLRDVEAFMKGTSSHPAGSELQLLPRLTHLNFRCEGLSSAASRALVPVLRRLTSLQELCFLWNAVEEPAASALAAAIGALPRLATVSLRHSTLLDIGAAAVSSSWGALTTLRCLDLSSCLLSCDATAAVAGVLANYPHLETLDLSGCTLVDSGGVDVTGVQALADALQAHAPLQHLFLRNVGLSNESAKVLAPCIARQTGLRSLYLQCNYHLRSAGIVEIARRLEGLSCLEALRLDCTGADPAASRALGGALQRLTALKTLNLIGFYLHSADTLAQTAFGASFSNLARLEVLDLSGSNFQGPAAQGLARALRTMPSLQELHLQYNPIGDIGAMAVAPALARLANLREVNLIHAQLSDGGAQEIVRELDGHPSLELCLLDFNKFESAGQRRRWLSAQTDDLSKKFCLEEYWRRAMGPF